MSVIQTCRLNQVNPLEYFAALREHTADMLNNPSRWLPWNYRQTLQALDTS